MNGAGTGTRTYDRPSVAVPAYEISGQQSTRRSQLCLLGRIRDADIRRQDVKAV